MKKTMMKKTSFSARAGDCLGCGKFFDWTACYATSLDGKYWGNGLNIIGFCRKCMKERRK